MRDKGVVALDWALSVQPRAKRKSTVLLVLPPITGDAFTVSALCCLATWRGFRTLMFNRRGHGGSVLTTPKLQSSCDPSYLRQVCIGVQKVCVCVCVCVLSLIHISEPTRPN